MDYCLTMDPFAKRTLYISENNHTRRTFKNRIKRLISFLMTLVLLVTLTAAFSACNPQSGEEEVSADPQAGLNAKRKHSSLLQVLFCQKVFKKFVCRQRKPRIGNQKIGKRNHRLRKGSIYG